MEIKDYLYLDVKIDSKDGYCDLEHYKKIKEILSKYCINLDIDTEKNTLSLGVNQKAIKRGAGRRKKFAHRKEDADEYGFYSYKTMLTLSDIEEMQKRMTDEQIVEELNLSRSTFYRHLKKAKEKRTDNYDPYF